MKHLTRYAYLAGFALQLAGCSSDQGNKATASNGCKVSASATMSTIIPTVATVTFTTSLATVSSAHIQFGLDTNYGMTAPVDLTQQDYKTLLLGMKSSNTYHYRVVVQSDSIQCTSDDYTVTTDAHPNNIRLPTITTYTDTVDGGAALDGGFLVLEGYQATAPDDYAYILDGDGDVVWWFKATGLGDLSAAKMSYDGNHMWLVHSNTPIGTAHAGRVTMDGETFEDLSEQFSGVNHDLAVLPDETVVFIAYNSNGCDDIKKRTPDGTVTTIINSSVAFGNATSCHCNAVQYSKDDDTIIFSDDDHSAYVKVDLAGNIQWVLNGGEFNSFDKSGGGATGWSGNHGLHILARDHLIIFNNGTNSSTGGTGAPSVVRELKLDLDAMTTSEIWSYTSTPPISNVILGDVQRLDNGNTLVTYSLDGTVDEVDSNRNLLQRLAWPSGKFIGYSTKRKSLYGPPPR